MLTFLSYREKEVDENNIIVITNPVELHVVHIFLIDLQHSVSIFEATEFSGAPGLHLPDDMALSALLHAQVKAKTLALSALQLAQSRHRALVWF